MSATSAGRLLLIRHAQPFHVRDDGPADPGLTPSGVEQAERLAVAVAKGRYGDIDRIVSSPMRRARETAERIAAATGMTSAVDDRIAELDRGWSSYGVDLDAYDDRQLLLADMNAGRIGSNTFDINEFRERVLAGAADIVAEGGDTVAVVCHGGVINVVLSDLLGTENNFFTEPYYTSVTRVRVSRSGHRQIETLNETHHLWE